MTKGEYKEFLAVTEVFTDIVFNENIPNHEKINGCGIRVGDLRKLQAFVNKIKEKEAKK